MAPWRECPSVGQDAARPGGAHSVASTQVRVPDTLADYERNNVGHRCLGTQVTDRGLTEVLTSPNKHYWGGRSWRWWRKKKGTSTSIGDRARRMSLMLFRNNSGRPSGDENADQLKKELVGTKLALAEARASLDKATEALSRLYDVQLAPYWCGFIADVDPLALEILSFWFGACYEGLDVRAEQYHLWFGKSPETDMEISCLFQDHVLACSNGAYDHWAAHPVGLLALVIPMDQVQARTRAQKRERSRTCAHVRTHARTHGSLRVWTRTHTHAGLHARTHMQKT